MSVAVKQAPAGFSLSDRLGAWRVRWNIGRNRYAVEPGLYRVGSPGPDDPVIVTANYKLTFDVVRTALADRAAWMLVLDTNGINVWCAAGKGTFGTMELARRVLESGLAEHVSHRTLVVPQLGATGVAAHDVREFTGFRVAWGPVRAGDLPAFLDSGMKPSDQMRRVTFTMGERLVLTPVELSHAWRPRVLLAAAALAVVSGFGTWGFSADAVLERGGWMLAAGFAGLLAGALLAPLFLPQLPFRMFSAKGALLGAIAGAAVAYGAAPVLGWLAALGLLFTAVAVASYMAMNFTGATTFTSPTGVEFEMRKSLPWQVASAGLALVLWVSSAVVGVSL